LSLAESIHQLLKGSGTLDLEEDFIVVIGDLDIEVFTLATGLGLLWSAWASVIVRSRHVDQKVKWIWSCSGWRERGYRAS